MELSPYQKKLVDVVSQKLRLQKAIIAINDTELQKQGKASEFHSYWTQNIEIITHQAPVGRPRQYPTVADKTQKLYSSKWWGEHVKKWQKTCLISGASSPNSSQRSYHSSLLSPRTRTMVGN